MGFMALTPETSAALKQAIEAIVQECGDDPEYAHLVEALQAAEDAIPADAQGEHGDHGGDHEAPAEDAGEHESADDMFAAAEAKHRAKRKAKGNPFADKGDDHKGND